MELLKSLSNSAHVGSWLELDVEFVKLGARWKLVGSCGQSLSNSVQVGNWLEVVGGVKEFSKLGAGWKLVGSCGRA